jgi:hypothetical protein
MWNDGQLLNTKTQEEVMYLHFINWKRTMSFSEVNYTEDPKSFYVSYLGMHYKPFSKLRLRLNAVKNVFFGYNIRMKRKKIQKKIKKKL